MYRPHPTLGTLQARDLNKIPEYKEGTKVVGAWLLEYSYAMHDLSTQTFMTTFLVICILGGSVVTEGWGRIRENFETLPQSERHAALLRGENKDFVILDALSFFSNDHADSLDRGVLFLG